MVSSAIGKSRSRLLPITLDGFAHQVWIGFKKEIPEKKGFFRWTT
jgi:hypothetical protein